MFKFQNQIVLAMLNAVALMIVKIIIMILLLGAMALLLFGIGYLFNNEELNTVEDNRNLREEIKKEERVVGKKSIFSNFLVRNYVSGKNSNKER